MTTIDPTKPYRGFDALHPSAFLAFSNLWEALKQGYASKETSSKFEPFETYRHPLRQKMLYAGQNGVTKARPYTSAHQFGLAVDFVPNQSGWTWDQAEDWEYLRATAVRCGLTVPYKWDRVHVEHPRFEWLRHDITRL